MRLKDFLKSVKRNGSFIILCVVILIMLGHISKLYKLYAQQSNDIFMLKCMIVEQYKSYEGNTLQEL